MIASRGRRAIAPVANGWTRAPRRHAPGAHLRVVAATMQRLAVFISAGLPPASAWQLVGESENPVAAAVGAAPDPVEALVRASAGRPTLERSGWRALAALWSVASETGAPLAAALRHVAEGILATAEIERENAAALAAPSATARLILALPFGAVFVASMLGLGTLEVLVGSPVGWGCLAIGVTLVLLARVWTRRLVASASSHDVAPGLECELMAVALAAGVSVDRARRVVEQALARAGWATGPSAIDAVIELCARAGAPAGELLRAEAAELRREAHAAGRVAAAVLSVRLMLPLGLCVLPAFVVLGIVPVLLGVIGSTANGLP